MPGLIAHLILYGTAVLAVIGCILGGWSVGGAILVVAVGFLGVIHGLEAIRVELIRGRRDQ